MPEAVERSLDAVRRIVLPRLDAQGTVAGAWAQGSLVEGLATEADLDVVVVWDPAPPPVRAVDGIADPTPSPVAFDEPGFVLDRFFLGGQQVDLKHVGVDEAIGWVDAVDRGVGPATSGYPMPVIALHGLVTGVVLRDGAVVSTLHARADAALPTFALSARHRAATGWPGYRADLERCVARGDGMLFHQLAVAGVRMLFVAWFARQGRWWPHEKRLGTRLRALGRHDLADAEESVWSGDAWPALEWLAELVLGELGTGARPEVRGRGRKRPGAANAVVSHDPSWPAQFEDLATALRPVVAPAGASVEHVGSTSVPGLAAKPIVDMAVVAERAADVPALLTALTTAGYRHRGDLGLPGREAFDIPPHLPYHHLYLVVRDTPPHRDWIDLRDHLRQNPDAARRYGDHKLAIAHLIQHDSRHAYLAAKASVIDELLAEARRPSPPRLVLLNGPPGIGKSTVARRLVLPRPLALCLDIDELRRSLGGWQQHDQAKQRARDLGVALASDHLRAGHDVVVPQLLGRVEFVERLDETARARGATFVHVMLLAVEAGAAARFRARRVELAGVPHPQDEIDEQRVPEVVRTTIESLRRMSERRGDAVVVDASGSLDETVARVAAAAWRT